MSNGGKCRGGEGGGMEGFKKKEDCELMNAEKSIIGIGICLLLSCVP